jgi:hypothetical protein
VFPTKGPVASAEYVDPGSDEGRYEMTEVGFLGSRLGADCCTETRGGGPGRISVARDWSPSRCGGCTTCTPDSKYAGMSAVDAIVGSSAS